ncbi:hypothetical protein MTX20_11505 [Bradyrhizobium sp. ISRA435]|nr:hypothetical protein MTX20_11505 [Bradyrhizobium sp. ISRA435]
MNTKVFVMAARPGISAQPANSQSAAFLASADSNSTMTALLFGPNLNLTAGLRDGIHAEIKAEIASYRRCSP